MKKIFFCVLLFSNISVFSQYTTIPDSNFEKALIYLGIDTGAIDGKVLTARVSGVPQLDVTGKNITDLTGIQDFLALSGLHCMDNALTNLDISKNTALTVLNCSNNQLTSLDITKNTSLTNLICWNNKLTSIDVTKNTALTNFEGSSNQFTNLDVTKNIVLTNLDCRNNLLTTLDISKNTFLTDLSCTNNKLTSLDLTKNILLTLLNCASNQLTSLDVTINTALTGFTCESNQLTSLDLTNNNALTNFDCSNNRLNSLDVTRNTALTVIYCNNNQLTSLNLKNGNNTNINTIFFNLKSNPNLTCIQVDNTGYSNSNWSLNKDASAIFSENCTATTPNNNIAPKITAVGDQAYCLLSSINIVTDIDITDPDPGDTTLEAVYIQISSGYVKGEDKLFLNNASSHTTIMSSWNASEGKLTLKSPTTGTQVTFTDFENAIKDIQFTNSSSTANGTRNFSISIGQANYLPRNGHYYEFINSPGISWADAKADAELRVYYGIKGYLATLTALDEAQLAGKQAQGNGWIGGSDSETEGVWKWTTGPEAGTVFWNGLANGSSPNFALWDYGEPNNIGNNENYAHITATGFWNDLPNSDGFSGGLPVKGYIIEYGDMPGDPELHLSASTTLTVASISTTTSASRCDAGTVTLQATATTGTISWYDSAMGGTLLGTNPSFSTPSINTTTTFYVEAKTSNCSSPRKPVEAKVTITPSITSTNTPSTHCGPGSLTLTATSTAGTINWYSQIGEMVAHNEPSYTTPPISTNTTYYAEALNEGCANTNKVPVDLIIYPLPIVPDENLEKCSASSIILDAGISNMTYLWSTGENTEKITVSTPGIYTVDITSLAPQNCKSRKTITVVNTTTPEIKNVKVEGTTVSIEMVKNENYFKFSIDGFNYQSSNLFTNVPTGLQTAYVRDTYQCNTDTAPFIVMVIPKFFTPNNDHHNDRWEVRGLADYPLGEVIIFDRYGKIITVLNHTNLSWDGTLNQKPLPASDYWYVLKFTPESPEVKGHFSLKR